MEGAKRNADSMDKTSSFTDNTNNVPNATEIPAEAPTGSSSSSSSGSRIYDSNVSIPLPPLPFYSALGAYSNIPPSWRNTGNYSAVRPALLGSSSSNQPAETSENEERHSKKICLENREGESFQPSNQANDVIPTNNHLSEFGPTTAAASSSSSAGNATPVQLVPVTNPDPQPSASSVPLTPQVMDFTTYMNMKSQQYAERAELRMHIFQNSMLFRHDSASASRQNDDNAEDAEDEDDWDDDTFDTDTDDDDDDDDYIDDSLGEEEDGDVAPGLTEEQIVKAMKTEKYTANTTTTDSSCPICWEDYKDEEVIGRLDCNHAHGFHTDCIKSWLRKHNSCPLCRMNGLVL